MKAANEAEAEKYEEQLRNVQKKMQVGLIIYQKTTYYLLYQSSWMSMSTVVLSSESLLSPSAKSQRNVLTNKNAGYGECF